MAFRLEKCGSLPPENCEDIFRHSAIYERYYSGGTLPAVLARAASAGELYLALDEEDRPVGAMWVSLRGFCGLYPYLKLIGVHERCRGQGLGAFLLGELDRMALESGARRVTLMVSDFNEGGQRLYERMGYWKLGELPNAAREGITEFVMVKDLL